MRRSDRRSRVPRSAVAVPRPRRRVRRWRGAQPADAGRGRHVMRRHGELLADLMGEQRGLRDFRKHVPWYLKGFPAGGELRAALGMVESLTQLDELLASWTHHPLPRRRTRRPPRPPRQPARPHRPPTRLARRHRRPHHRPLRSRNRRLRRLNRQVSWAWPAFWCSALDTATTRSCPRGYGWRERSILDRRATYSGECAISNSQARGNRFESTRTGTRLRTEQVPRVRSPSGIARGHRRDGRLAEVAWSRNARSAGGLRHAPALPSPAWLPPPDP